MIESDADRLALIQAVGEQFDTGKPTRMWAVFDEAYVDAGLERIQVSSREPMLQVRTSDVALHELVKKSPITRVSDGAQYSVKEFEPDGTGMTMVRLTS